MQGKSRTILQFNVRHWRRRPWRKKEDKSSCLMILSVFGRECCRSTATYEKVTQQQRWWKRQGRRRRRRRNVPCDNKVDERDREKKKTFDATTKFMKEAKRINTRTADCRCHQITIPRHRDLSKKHKINHNNIKLQNRMSPFPQLKIFWKQNIKPCKKCPLQQRKREHPILKLAYKTSSLLRREKNTLREDIAVQPQQTRDQGDVRTEHKRLQREWTRSYGGAGVVPKQTPTTRRDPNLWRVVVPVPVFFFFHFFSGEIWIFSTKKLGNGKFLFF